MNLRTLTLLAALGLLPACAPDRMSLEPYGLCTVTADCKFSSKCDTYLLGPLAYSQALNVALVQPIEMRNQSPDNANANVGRVNSNDAHITAYQVKYGNGWPALTRYDGAQTVPAGGSSIVFAVLAMPGTPMPTTADVSFYGYYDNGREFVTEPYQIGLQAGPAGGYACAKAGDIVTCPYTLPLGANAGQNNAACKTP